MGQIKVGHTLLNRPLPFVVVVHHLQIRVVAATTNLGTGDLPLTILDRIQAFLYFLDLLLHRIHDCPLKVADLHHRVSLSSIPLVFRFGLLRGGAVLVARELRIELGL